MIAFKTNRKVAFAASAVATITLGLGLQVATSAPASAQQCTSDSTDNRGCAVIVGDLLTHVAAGSSAAARSRNSDLPIRGEDAFRGGIGIELE